MDHIEKSVLRLHEQGLTVRAIHLQLRISEYKVQKILCNAGIAPSARAAQVQALLQAGLSQDQIAARLGVSRRAIQRYIPYSRGLQNADYPTINALRIRKSRAKKKGDPHDA